MSTSTFLRIVCAVLRQGLLPCLLFSAFLPASAGTAIVDIGLGGFPNFRDQASGSQSIGTNPAITVLRVGDTVEWHWHYTHSTTSGQCVNFVCTPNGIWDSAIHDQGFVFRRTFNTAGAFDYFCLIHLSQMTGRVIVLNGPDYFLDVPASDQFGASNRSLTVFAGRTATYSGLLAGFLGYSNTVNLSCQNGVPHNPATCPAIAVLPAPLPGTPFNFSVSDPTANDYMFNIVGTGTDPAHIVHSQPVELHVFDYGISAPAPATITALNGQSSAPSNFQLTSANFQGSVNLTCEGLPDGATCTFLLNGTEVFSLFMTPGAVFDLEVLINNIAAMPGTYSVQVTGTTFDIAPPGVRSQNLTIHLVGPTNHFLFSTPASVTAGAAFTLSTTALDSASNTVTNYAGTIQFSSSDGAAALPAAFTFSGTENGTHSFAAGATLNTVGPNTISIPTADGIAGLAGVSAIIKATPATTNNSAVVAPSRNPTFFKHARETFTATVTASSGTTSPTGTVTFFDGTTAIGSPALAAAGSGKASASIVISHLALGDHEITAVYNGATGPPAFTKSVSSIVTVRASPAPRCAPNERCP